MDEQAGQKVPVSSEGSGQAGSNSRRWFPWVGAGLAVGGVVAAVAGLVVDVRPGRGEFPGLAVFGAVVVAVTLVVVLVLSVRVWRDPFGAAFGRRRRWAAYAAILAVLVGGYAWWQTTIDLGGGMVTVALPLFAAGLTMVAAGAALVATARDEPAPRRLVVTGGVAVLTAVVGGAVAVTAAVLVERAPVDATTAPVAEPVAVDQAPEQVRWHWETPSGEQIRWDDIVPTPTGVAVRVSDGVVALDAETGEETWRYRRSGARVASIAASPSGSWVMATFYAGNTDDGGVRLMAFDGRTGEVGFDETRAGFTPAFGGVRLDLTDETLIGGVPDDGRYTGFALPDGQRLWDWQVPNECYVGDSTFGVLPAAATVLVALVCVDDQQEQEGEITGAAAFVGLLAGSGEEAWRSTHPFTRPRSEDFPDSDRVFVDADVRVSGDGAVARLAWNVRGEQNFSSMLVDTATGAELAAGGSVAGMPASSFDSAGVLTQADGEYTLTPLDNGAARAVTSGCDHLTTSRAAVADTLVELCMPEDYTDGVPLTVAVTPWAEAGQAREFDVDLGPYADGSTVDSPYLAKLPAVTVAILGGGTRLTALG